MGRTLNMTSTKVAPNGEGDTSQVTQQATLPDRTAPPEEGAATGDISKSAAKKAAKREKAAAEKANKASKPIGKDEAKQPTSQAPKATKSKKMEGVDEKSIGMTKEADFSGWYQQVLTKGEMLDYYDVSGCYILKVNRKPYRVPILAD